MRVHHYRRFGILVIFLMGWGGSAHAGCEGTFVGATDDNPIFSSVDVTFSPTYSGATTSGTSKCPNWDFVQYLDKSRQQFIVKEKLRLMEEIAQGQGRQLNALAQMMGCPATGYSPFSKLLHDHYQQVSKHLMDVDHSKQVLDLVKAWVQANPVLKNECQRIS